jgi:hypothetical protein
MEKKCNAGIPEIAWSRQRSDHVPNTAIGATKALCESLADQPPESEIDNSVQAVNQFRSRPTVIQEEVGHCSSFETLALVLLQC